MIKKVSFTTQEEGMQYLADEISALSKRVTKLENVKLAHGGLITWLISILQHQDETTKDTLIKTLDAFSDQPSDDPEVRERHRAVQEIMRDIILRGQAIPSLTVIPGGKNDS